MSDGAFNTQLRSSLIQFYFVLITLAGRINLKSVGELDQDWRFYLDLIEHKLDAVGLPEEMKELRGISATAGSVEPLPNVTEQEISSEHTQAEIRVRPGPPRKLSNVSRDDLIALVALLYKESADRGDNPPTLFGVSGYYGVSRRTVERYIADVLQTDWKTIRTYGELAAKDKT